MRSEDTARLFKMTEAAPDECCSPAKADASARASGLAALRLYMPFGILLALLLLGTQLWTPLRVCYYEWQVRRTYADIDSPTFELTDSSRRAFGRGIVAIYELIDMGPVAAPALKRLLSSGGPSLRCEVVGCLRLRGANAWVFPLLVFAAQDHDAQVADLARTSAGMRLRNDAGFFPTTDGLLDWWDREGSSRYGGTKGTGVPAQRPVDGSEAEEKVESNAADDGKRSD